jgi:hypothetical protein|tara:strand:- start:1067 stop:1717 length:651 start_codon:yes stop_codon:yes gene_type:complete
MQVEILVPDTLSEITLEQYQKFLKIQDNNEDETFLAIKMIEIFCGIRGDTIMKMKASSIRDITTILTDMFNQKPPLVREFTMKGKEYGFIPKLEDMSFGEYVDLDTYVGDFENIHKAMAVLYRPITQKYNDKYLIEEYEGEDNQIMKDMPMDAVLSSIIFFYNLGMDLSKVMLNYLHQEETQDLVQQLNLEKNGDGINHFSDSLKEILDGLKISLN